MSPDPGRPFTVEPWVVREPTLDMESLGVTETVFALSNGHIGLRGNLDEGEPHATPGHLPQLLLRAAPAAVRRGRLRLPGVRPDHHQRHQRQDHPAAGGRRAVRPALRPAAPPPARARPAVGHADPRGPVEQPGGQDGQGAQRAAGLAHPAGGRRDLLRGRGRGARADRRAVRAGGQRAAARRRTAATRGSRPRCTTRWSPSSTAATTPARRWCTTPATRGCAWPRRWTTRSAGPEGTKITSEASEDIGRTTVICRLEPGTVLRVVKYLAYGWSSRRSLPAVHDQVRAGLAAARYTGWDGLLAEQRAFLDEFWTTADVEIDGDAELQQAVRVAVFHVLQAGARAERRAIGAKGLTGPGYDGHTFWDTETFCLPVLSHLQPDAAADALQLAPVDPAAGPRAGRAAGPGRRGVPVADDPRPGVLGLLAGRHGGVPHQRRHRRRRAAPRADHRRHRVRARGRPRDPGRARRGCGARWATTTRPASSASTA